MLFALAIVANYAIVNSVSGAQVAEQDDFKDNPNYFESNK